MKPKFNWREFIAAVCVIAVPVALQNLLTTTGSMVDTMMIAPLGEQTVAAVGLCAQFASLMFSCYWGFVGGGMLFFSQFWGANDEKGIERAYGTTLICMMTVGAIFTGVGTLAPELIMRVFTDKPAIQAIGVQYLKIAALSYPFQIYSMAMSAMLRSTEQVKIPLVGSIISVCTNIILNYILINGKLGLPALGVRGAAAATVCAGFINCLTVLLAAKIKKYPFLFRFKQHFQFSGEWIKTYLGKCFPILCNELLVGIGFMTINIVLGRQPEAAIAALAVFRTFEGFIISFFSGFSNAASVLVGKNVGAGEPETAYERAKRLIYLCGGVIAAVGLIIFSVHKPLLQLMSLSGESLQIGTGMLGIYLVAAVIRMCNWAQNDTFRSAGDATFGTVMEISFMYAMVIPCVCLSGLVFQAPTLLVFAFGYVDEPIRFIFMQKHLYSGKWLKPVTPQGIKALQEYHQRKKTEK